MAYAQSLLILLSALLVTPWCLARRVAPGADLTTSLTVAGVAGLLLNLVLPVTLHVLAIPITTDSLCAAHLIVAALTCLAAWPPHRLRPPTPTAGERNLLWACGLFALIVLPVGPLAGIDTYKWQGMATNVEVEQSIPWLVHPLSLLGFTPRAYPSAQPLMLATVQAGPLLGVETGFWVVSVFSGVLGLCASFCLARRLSFGEGAAFWMAVMYVFSPVFMRYSHWATGRGLFLAAYPAFLAACMARVRLSSCAALLATALVLPLTHKTGLVALGIWPLTLVSRLVMPRRPCWLVMALLMVPTALGAILLSPPIVAGFPLGCLPGAVLKSVTRFGIYMPLAVFALFLSKDGFTPARRALILPFFVTFPLAFPSDMYGAMLALPFVAVGATIGLQALLVRFAAQRTPLLRAAAVLTLACALAVVLNRNLHATPRAIRTAARFLDAHDPRGPFEVHAPGRARVQFHAYVSGCPRFVITAGADTSITRRRPPPMRGEPATLARDWIDYLRNFFEVPELDIDWYGHNPRQYYVEVNGEGDVPAGALQLYARDGIAIYAPAGQQVTHDPTR